MRNSKIEKLTHKKAMEIIDSYNFPRLKINGLKDFYGTTYFGGFSYLVSVAVTENLTLGKFFTSWVISFRFDLLEYFFENHLLDFGMQSINKGTHTSFHLKLELAYPEITSKSYFKFPFITFDNTKDGIEEYAQVSKLLIDDYLLPYAKKVNDVHFLNNIVNSELRIIEPAKRLNGNNLASAMKRLVVAKMANDNNFDKLEEHVKSILMKDQPEFFIGNRQEPLYSKFLSYLETIQPLKNPDLYSKENIIL